MTGVMSPITLPGLLYPSFATPRPKDFSCPTCRSTNRTSITSIIFTPTVVKELNKALGEWNDWVFKQGVTGVFKGHRKIEGYNFLCRWDGTSWFVASALILNDIVTDQITQIYTFTKETKKEFGALILRNEKGIYLDMTQVGEDMAIMFEQTRLLEKDEEILGTCHVHPCSDTFSHWDIATAINSDFEQISMVVGAEGTLSVIVKTPETLKISGNLETTVKSWESVDKPLQDIALEYKFLLYSGKPSDLKLVSGEEGTVTLEDLVKNAKGSKSI